MSVRELPIKVTTANGKLRADLPAATIEAEDVDGLLAQIRRLAEGIMEAAEKGARDILEDLALREIEKNAPRREVLERLAARYPAPQAWFDEPE